MLGVLVNQVNGEKRFVHMHPIGIATRCGKVNFVPLRWITVARAIAPIPGARGQWPSHLGHFATEPPSATFSVTARLSFSGENA